MAKKKTNPNPPLRALREQAIKSTLKPAMIKKHVAAYAKQHALSAPEAERKLLSVAIGRLQALGKYNAKPAAKRKTAKASAGKVARKPRKVKAPAKKATPKK